MQALVYTKPTDTGKDKPRHARDCREICHGKEILHREALHEKGWFSLRADCVLQFDRVCSALDMQRLPKAALHYSMNHRQPRVTYLLDSRFAYSPADRCRRRDIKLHGRSAADVLTC